MKMITRPFLRDFRPLAWLTLIAALSTPAVLQAQHLNAGAAGTNQNDKLTWANGAAFIASSGYIQNLPLGVSGTYSNTFNGGPTLTALPSTVANGGPVAFAPALGSFLQFKMTLSNAPAGGQLSFWETGATNATQSIGVGGASGLFPLSSAAEGAGAAGADPYGHLHGRRFTASEPGSYLVGFQIVDTSTNGGSRGPIHTPSDFLFVNFRASLAISSMVRAKTDNAVTVTFATRARKNYSLEASPGLGGTNWAAISVVPMTNQPAMRSVVDTNTSGSLRFYRLREMP